MHYCLKQMVESSLVVLLPILQIPANLEYIGQGSEGDIEEIILRKPSFLDIHRESADLHPIRFEPRDLRESPESSVSPEVILVPPPYSEPGTPSLTEQLPDTKQEKLQVHTKLKLSSNIKKKHRKVTKHNIIYIIFIFR